MSAQPQQPKKQESAQHTSAKLYSSPSSNTSLTSSNILINIILLAAIGLVFLGAQNIKNEIDLNINTISNQIQAKKIEIAAADSKHQEAIIAQTKVQNKKNVMCPEAKNDLDSCAQKLTRCKQTEGEFLNAQKQFTQLISDCAKSNSENERINNQMEKDIIKMQEDFKFAQKNS